MFYVSMCSVISKKGLTAQTANWPDVPVLKKKITRHRIINMVFLSHTYNSQVGQWTL